MNDTTLHTSRATTALADLFWDILSEDPILTFEAFEERTITAGHKAMAHAMGLALERFDKLLCASLPEEHRIHDKRPRMLATEVGDVAFEYRRVRNNRGETSTPFAEALDLPWGCRVSPGATSFLTEAAAEVSYASAARLLERKGGSQVS